MLDRIHQLAGQIGRRHLLNFASYFVSKALSLGLFAFAVSYFVRRSGDHLYGLVSLILLLYTYLQMVDMGMGYAVVYRVGRAQARRGSGNVRMVAEALPIYLACSVVIALGLVLFAGPLARFLLGNTEHAFLFVLAALGIGCLILSALCVAVMQAYNRVYYVNASRLVFDVVKAVALITAAAAGGSLATVLWLTLAGAILKLVVDICLASRLLGTFAWLRPVVSGRALRLNAGLGAPMFMSSLVSSAMNSVDKVVVVKLLTPSVLAVYSIVNDLHTKAYFLLWAVTGSLYTPFIQRQSQGQSVRPLILLAVMAIAAFFLFYYVPLAIFGREILNVWINPEMGEKGYELLRWLLLPTFFYMVSNLMEVFLQTAGETKLIGWAYLLGLAVQIAALSVLPKHFGAMGVIWSVSLMHFSLLCSFIYMIMKRRKSHRARNSCWTPALAKSDL